MRFQNYGEDYSKIDNVNSLVHYIKQLNDLRRHMLHGAFWGEFFLKYDSGEKDVTIEPRHTFVFGNCC